METTDAFRGLACTDCGCRVDAADPAIPDPGRCPDCDAPLTPDYDLDALDPDSLREGRTVWDRDAILPFPREVAVSAAEGGTPLVETPRVADEMGVGCVQVKDEGRNPTGTALDRGLSVAVTAAAGGDIDLLACATPGNAGQSMAAYAGRVDLRSYAFVPSRAPFSAKAMVNVHGGEMRVVPGRFDDAVDALAEDLQSDYASMQEFTTPYRHEGVKTLAYEVLADRDWSVPDAVVVPCGTGEVVVGVATGLRECRDLGLVETLPRLFAVQPTGCAPVATAWGAGRGGVEPWATPDTIVGELEIPDPAGGDLALDAVAETGGKLLAVEDADALESAVAVASTETLEVGLAGGVAMAGAWQVADSGELAGDDDVVVVNTEAATKTPDVLRSHLMGQGI